MEPLRILSWSQMARIGGAAQAILERTGIKIDSPEALGFLHRFGCRVDHNTSLVKIPRELSRAVVGRMKQDCLRPHRPERMAMRYTHVRFRATPFEVHQDFTVNTGGFCCFIHGLDNVRRPAGRDDVLCAINMVNHLDQIDYTGLPVADQSIAAEHRPVVMAAELVKWTRKIGGIKTFTKNDVALDSRNRAGGRPVTGRTSSAVEPLFRYADETPSRVPLSDWFVTTDAKKRDSKPARSWAASSSSCSATRLRGPARRRVPARRARSASTAELRLSAGNSRPRWNFGQLSANLGGKARLGAYPSGAAPGNTSGKRGWFHECATRPIVLSLTCLAVMVLGRNARAADWPQWGGTPGKNMAADEKGLPDSFVPGKKDSHRHDRAGYGQEREMGPQGMCDNVLDARGGRGQGVSLRRGRRPAGGHRLPG